MANAPINPKEGVKDPAAKDPISVDIEAEGVAEAVQAEVYKEHAEGLELTITIENGLLSQAVVTGEAVTALIEAGSPGWALKVCRHYDLTDERDNSSRESRTDKFVLPAFHGIDEEKRAVIAKLEAFDVMNHDLPPMGTDDAALFGTEAAEEVRADAIIAAKLNAIESFESASDQTDELSNAIAVIRDHLLKDLATAATSATAEGLETVGEATEPATNEAEEEEKGQD